MVVAAVEGDQQQQSASWPVAQVARRQPDNESGAHEVSSSINGVRGARGLSPRRVSSTITPSRMLSNRSAVVATRGSWVTSNRLWPPTLQISEQREELSGGCAVQAPGRLISQDQRRRVHQRAGQRYPLPLTTRQAMRQIIGAAGHSELFQQIIRSASRGPTCDADRGARAVRRSRSRSARRADGMPGIRTRSCVGEGAPTAFRTGPIVGCPAIEQSTCVGAI